MGETLKPYEQLLQDEQYLLDEMDLLKELLNEFKTELNEVRLKIAAELKNGDNQILDRKPYGLTAVPFTCSGSTAESCYCKFKKKFNKMCRKLVN